MEQNALKQNTVMKFPTQAETIFLPLSQNYVEHWGFWEAVREFIQNAVDADDDALVRHSNGKLDIVSKGILEPKTLLLGESGKRNDDSAIGTYGEGYKLALLVLTRMGYKVTIISNGNLWESAFKQHPQLGVDCLAVTITKNFEPANGEVRVEISGVGARDLTELREKYLPFSEESIEVVAEYEGSQVLNFDDHCDHDINEDDYGHIESVKYVFVKGLMVCELPKDERYWFSYNFTPERIELDRDRNSVSSWTLQYQATKLLTEACKAHLLARMAGSNAKDISGSFNSIISSSGDSSFRKQIQDMAEKQFILAYGESAYPINKDWSDSKQRYYAKVARAEGMLVVYIDEKAYAMLSTTFRERSVTQIKQQYDKLNVKLEKILEENKKHMRSKPFKKLEMLLAQMMVRGV